MPAEQLSGTIVVIIIAICVQGFIMVIIFAKRQIMRFAIRNRSGPHMHIGHGAPKPLRREADRCLDYIPYIRHEPPVRPLSSSPDKPEGHFHRAKALEAYANFELGIVNYSSNYTRLPGTQVRSFLLRCSNGPLMGVDSHQIHLLCDEYEHARHHFEEFGPDKLEVFMNRIMAMTTALEANKAVKPHPSPQPLGGPGGSSPGNHRTNRRKRQKDQHLAPGSGNSGVSSGAGINKDTILTRNLIARRSSRAMLLPSTSSGGIGAGGSSQGMQQTVAV